jgi:hypothetical protein
MARGSTPLPMASLPRPHRGLGGHVRRAMRLRRDSRRWKRMAGTELPSPVTEAMIRRPDTRYGPPVDLWGAALRQSDVQKQPQAKPTGWHEVLVILGTGEVWR